MGAYLSRPKTEKESASGSTEWISFGASSMQGWRRFQEDAHNCLPDFDPKRTASLFAVYDGHGGSEVAKYCSLHLPEYILSYPRFTDENGVINPISILKSAFVEFDKTLVQPKAKVELRHIANPEADEAQGSNSGTDDEKECCGDNESDDGNNLVPESVEELSALHEEATRPLEAVLRNQCGDDIPEFIQTLLSSLRPKAVEASGSRACCSTCDDPTKQEDEDGATTAAQDVEGSCSGLVETPSVTKKARISPQKQEGQLEEATDGEKKIANEPAGDAVDTDDTPVIVGVDDSENNADDEDEEEGEDDDEDFEIDDDDEANEFDVDDSDEDDDDSDEDDVDEDSCGGDAEGSGDAADGFLPRPVGFCEPGVDSGTTACVALVLPEIVGLDGTPEVYLYVANAGDSRAVLCRAGAAVDLSEDHKPEDDRERERIQAAGGTVTADGRVNDGLNLSRAIGDHIYKQRKDLKMSEQMISALPDVTRTKLIPGADEFLVIACDGIWNSMTSQAVVDFVYDRLHPDPDGDGEAIGTCGSKHGGSGEESDLRSSPAFLEKISEELFEACLAPNTIGDGTGCDNMTCIILRFDDLSGLAKRAVTKTTDKEEELEVDEPAVAVVDATTNGNGCSLETGDHSDEDEASASPAVAPCSPAAKKARTEVVPLATVDVVVETAAEFNGEVTEQ